MEGGIGRNPVCILFLDEEEDDDAKKNIDVLDRLFNIYSLHILMEMGESSMRGGVWLH